MRNVQESDFSHPSTRRYADTFWMADHILLDHLYLHPKRQGQGIGSSVLRDIMTDADLKSMPIRLGALRGSDSNRFYERSGFVKVDEGEWDVYYVRVPCSVMKD
jgi:GNAT superfamily N-acetyltransferase